MLENFAIEKIFWFYCQQLDSNLAPLEYRAEYLPLDNGTSIPYSILF